jgi:hypothetical protein
MVMVMRGEAGADRGSLSTEVVEQGTGVSRDRWSIAVLRSDV